MADPADSAVASDPSDEHRDPNNDPTCGFHLAWPARDAQFHVDAPRIGVVARCGQLVPAHWAINVPALVGCLDCQWLGAGPEVLR